MSRLLSNAPAAAVLLAAAALSCAEPSSPNLESTKSVASSVDAPSLEEQHSGTTQRLQAVSPVNENVVWASGVGGTYTVTLNGGRRWRAGVVPGGKRSSSATCTA